MHRESYTYFFQLHSRRQQPVVSIYSGDVDVIIKF